MKETAPHRDRAGSTSLGKRNGTMPVVCIPICPLPLIIILVCTYRDSWNALAGMSKTDAMSKYISVVSRLDPEWESAPLESQTETKDGEKGGGSSSVGHAVSTLAGRDTEEALTDDKKTVFDWCKEGNEKKLGSLLTDSNVNQTDQEVIVCVPPNYMQLGKQC